MRDGDLWICPLCAAPVPTRYQYIGIDTKSVVAHAAECTGIPLVRHRPWWRRLNGEKK